VIKEYFEEIREPRQKGKVEHNLQEIIVMTIVAVMAGCEAWYQIHNYCKSKRKWFREKFGLKLKHGVASHDTFERVFALIDPKQFEKCFATWVGTLKEQTKQEIVAIDGKTIRASKGETRAIHMVSAWASKQKLVLAQVKTDEKTNEITAVPELLDLLDLEGCIVTADAMSCQKDIVEKITEKKADYCIGLKGNQGTLREDVELYFKDFKPANTYPTLEKGHGRIEIREYWLETDISWLWQRNNWKNLNAIGCVHSKVIEGEKTTEETRYFITSLTNVKTFAKAVREHWSIENSLHWCLDMGFNEDRCRMRKDNSGENFAVIRHIALNLLKKDKSNMSIKAKRHRCAYDENFLFKLITKGF